MIDHNAVLLALRAPLLTLSVCTTGSVSLSATSAGYARATGSFLTDGFYVGMEVTPSGFTQTAVGVITALTATLMTIKGGRTVQASGSGRSITAALPSNMGWDNVRVEPVTGEPYGEEDYVPAPGKLLGMSTGGSREETGLYVLRLYAPDSIGTGPFYAIAKAILALYPCGPGPVLTSGDQLFLRDDPAPFAGPVRPDKPGWAVCTITMFWRLYTSNT
jgi:hypothetical protein